MINLLFMNYYYCDIAGCYVDDELQVVDILGCSGWFLNVYSLDAR